MRGIDGVDGSSRNAILNSTILHNVLLAGAGTGGKTCPSRAMMATSDTVHNKDRLTPSRKARPSLLFKDKEPCLSWRLCVSRFFVVHSAFRTSHLACPVPGCQFPVSTVVFRRPGPRSPFPPLSVAVLVPAAAVPLAARGRLMHKRRRTGDVLITRPGTACLECILNINSPDQIRTLAGESTHGVDVVADVRKYLSTVVPEYLSRSRKRNARQAILPAARLSVVLLLRYSGTTVLRYCLYAQGPISFLLRIDCRPEIPGTSPCNPCGSNGDQHVQCAGPCRKEYAMSGRNGDGLMVEQRRLTTPERTRIASEAQMERFLDERAGRLGGRLEIVVREQVSKEVVPQLKALQERFDAPAADFDEAPAPVAPPAPTVVRVNPADLQQRARNRVD